MVNVCTFDNPITMKRECWQDGKLVVAYSYEVIIEGVPPEYYFFGADVGNWNCGKLRGAVAALPPDVLITYRKYCIGQM